MPKHTIRKREVSIEFGCERNGDGKWILNQAWAVKKWRIDGDLNSNGEFDTEDECKMAFEKVANDYIDQNFAD